MQVTKIENILITNIENGSISDGILLKNKSPQEINLY